jgi:spore coat protein CotH
MYKEIEFQGMDEPLKLFISIKPQRLPGETQTEYKLRRMMEKRGNMQKKYNPQYVQDPRLGTYVNKNKKDKFKKKK